MSNLKKILAKVLQGNADANIRFSELCKLLDHTGFMVRVKGSHHIFWRGDVEEILNLQPLGDKAKPYQVRQVRGLIVKYKIAGDVK